MAEAASSPKSNQLKVEKRQSGPIRFEEYYTLSQEPNAL